MTNIISGKILSENKRNELKEKIAETKKIYNREPHLVVILVGDNPASVSYVRGKEKASLEVGIKNTTIIKDENITEEELLNLIDELNNDASVDGILVQLPLPRHINEAKVIKRIDVSKDVDGFHPLNVAALFSKQECIYPCTPKGIIEMLDSIHAEIEGKLACVIGRSNIVGLPIYKLLLDRNATVITAHSKTKDLAKITSQADILIVAIGKAKFVTANMVKEGAIVIDVGVNRNEETGKLCGDVDFDNVKDKVSFISKVPGGVGPMTITCLMENTFECYLKRINK